MSSLSQSFSCNLQSSVHRFCVIAVNHHRPLSLFMFFLNERGLQPLPIPGCLSTMRASEAAVAGAAEAPRSPTSEHIHVKTNSANKLTGGSSCTENLCVSVPEVGQRLRAGLLSLCRATAINPGCAIWCGRQFGEGHRVWETDIKKERGATHIHHFGTCNLLTWIFPGCGFFAPVAPLSKLLKYSRCRLFL